MFYKQLHEKFFQLAENKSLLDNEITIKTRILKPAEAIGNPDRKDFPLLKGKEVLMEALFMKAKGHAYTDAPSEFSGPLRKIFDFQLDDSRGKALFIASLNAVMRHLYPDMATVHCKDNEPEECAEKMAEFIKTLKPNTFGLIGLQPAILDSMVKRLGAKNVSCIDRDEDNRGKIKYNVPIGWGDNEGMEKVFKKSDLVLATGSSAVNGSLVDILRFSKNYNKPIYFFGVTIAGIARLMELKSLCFKAT
ncbi:MAG: hypothetical protein SRB1_00464 [Desulfobacteraceae bacterium Eth-SRB1]|nr:MAG: hypothetical protein SRB1_00464 [Desulfobacteraceae bacterium Eth-SRB1]